MKENTCCFTGHRPEKLLLPEHIIQDTLEQEISIAISDGFTTFISGMARGVDLWAAKLVLQKKENHNQIKLICAIPYEGFEIRWSPYWKRTYRLVYEAADERKVFYPAFQYDSFQVRNRWMIDKSTRVIAVCHCMRGGTYNTLEYARTQKVEIRLIQG